MNSILKHFTTLLLLLMVATSAQAGKDNDFVARMMKQISGQPSLYQPSEYKQITVSPTMMQSVVEMLTSIEQNDRGQESANREIIGKLLKSVKSLRIFVASENIDSYRQLVYKTAQDNKRIYKIFKSENATPDAAKTHIWTRRSGNKVVEIITMLDPDAQSPEMRILNLTGVFTNDFVDLLNMLQN